MEGPAEEVPLWFANIYVVNKTSKELTAQEPHVRHGKASPALKPNSLQPWQPGMLQVESESLVSSVWGRIIVEHTVHSKPGSETGLAVEIVWSSSLMHKVSVTARVVAGVGSVFVTPHGKGKGVTEVTVYILSDPEPPTAHPLSQWMVDTGVSNDTEKNILQISLPGSHDSGTGYGLSKEIGHDEGNMGAILKAIEKIPFARVIENKIILDWSTSQDGGIYQQLEEGCRYIDIRSDYDEDKKEYRVVHGVMGARILDEVVADVKRFVSNHPGECVIAHFQSFSNMSDAQRVVDMFKKAIEILGQDTIVSASDWLRPLGDLTTSESGTKQGRVFMVVNHDAAKQFDGLLLPSSALTNPWPNSTDTDKVLTYVKDEYEKYKPMQDKQLFVTQGVLTPDAELIVHGILHPVRGPTCLRTLARVLNPVLFDAFGAGGAWDEFGGQITMCDFAAYTGVLAQAVYRNLRTGRGDSAGSTGVPSQQECVGGNMSLKVWFEELGQYRRVSISAPLYENLTRYIGRVLGSSEGRHIVVAATSRHVVDDNGLVGLPSPVRLTVVDSRV